ncbi:sigma-70 family RNA polymerase sigma factor [Oculatella sp. LEGE 06141]|uniref:sigma-70 family RNA polymerase sigma factor n=1 Tax=Oculatella sp. LEGE 06141 TaxID=1828648 RepID=UPI00187FAD93|nr:sigma-70 family RNA polymerase sigma factor [Oculatella sp. LEGE 06141]MBE9177974.1 sigma-70 family RNA polymerase sigma factor [Oculatella sp. LEGE 06141]
MRPRQDLIEIFSTFLQLEADRFDRWAIEPKLRRSMQQCLAQTAQTNVSENFWALYWHKIWQTQDNLLNLAKEHLLAYVQESCYWAAQKTAAGFASNQSSLADCFQMAIAQIDKVLKGFDSQQGFNFKNYASATFNSLIRELLRQRQEIDICTDWALLRKISQKRLTESLVSAGLASETIASYILAWSCFKTLYVPMQASGTRQLSKPDRQTWEAIAHLYNSERYTQLSSSGTAVQPESLDKWLLACAKAARAYLYPSQVSINAPRPGQETGEFLDNLPETVQTSLLADMIAEEEASTRQTQRSQLTAVLINALKQLDEQSQTLLALYYQDGLTQQQMAERLAVKQYTVSRRLTKAREALLLTLAKWSEETLHRTATADLLKHTSTALEEWLKTHYSHPDLQSPDIPQMEPPS